SYQHPFTGNRYVPGSTNNQLPSYGIQIHSHELLLITPPPIIRIQKCGKVCMLPGCGNKGDNLINNYLKDVEKHFTLSTHLTFDAYDRAKVVDRLRGLLSFYTSYWKFDERAFWEETLAFVVSLDYVADKTRELTNNRQAGSLVKPVFLFYPGCVRLRAAWNLFITSVPSNHGKNDTGGEDDDDVFASIDIQQILKQNKQAKASFVNKPCAPIKKM
uniref:Uncharacterized protein n=1 Tax=Glossina brevipalpis TaxID=37001 RepID=A0A1A9WBX5_9MUSC